MKSFKGYTGVNVKEKIQRDANKMLEDSLQGHASHECIIVPQGYTDKQFLTDVIFFQKWDSDGKAMKVIGRIGEIERGNYILYNNETWLITTKPEDNGTYRKAEAHLCSTDFPIKENDKVTIIGIDDWGRPIPEVVEGAVVMMPCVPKMNDASTAIAMVNESINELKNIITITIPYRESPSIEHDKRFAIWNESYRIIRIDLSNTVNGIGTLIITGERMDRSDG